MLLATTHGKSLTAAAVSLNILMVGLTFFFANPITRRLGRTGTKTVSKLTSMFLAAIAIMLMRKGIFQTIAAGLQ
jgi:multiple antibiotic resistance protein